MRQSLACYIKRFIKNDKYSIENRNCMHFVLNFIDYELDTNYSKLITPIKSHSDIKKVYRKHGYKGLVDFMNKNFIPRNSKLSKRGDIGYYKGLIGLNDGHNFFYFTEEGIISVPRKEIKKAWSWVK